METLNAKRIEELAEVVWKNTGGSDEPYGGRLARFHKLGEGTKDVYRRIAAAVAEALGYSLAEDVKPRPRLG